MISKYWVNTYFWTLVFGSLGTAAVAVCGVIFFLKSGWYALVVYGGLTGWNVYQTVDCFRKWREARREYLESVLDAIAKLDKD